MGAAPSSRAAANVFTRFDPLAEQVASAIYPDVVSALGVKEAVLDGEVIAADKTGRPQFYDLLRRTGSPIYVAFDVVWLKWYRSAVSTAQGEPAASPSDVAGGIALRGRFPSRAGAESVFELMCANDLEGIVAKRLADPCKSGDSG